MHYAQQGVLEYYIDLHAHANKKGAAVGRLHVVVGKRKNEWGAVAGTEQ